MVTSGTCDYLTVTAKHGTQEQASLFAIYDALKFGDDTSGLDEKPARALGYVGTKIGTLFVGQNTDGAMLRVSGELANPAAAMLGWLPGQHHITRVDFQLTWGYGHDMDEWFAQLADTIREAQAQQEKHTPSQVRHIRSFGKGDTVSVGARSSEVYIRVYDKSREQMSDTSEGLVRYEVELKGARALQAVQLLVAGKDYNRTVFEVVDYWMHQKLVPTPWGYEVSYLWPEVGRPETDAERKLRWLESHVRSSVTYLCLKGHRQLVLEALGLDTE